MIVKLIAFGLTLSLMAPVWAQPKTPPETLRHYYSEARDALDVGDISRYQKLRARLVDYALLPYLDYQELKQSLSNNPYRQVDNFLDQHRDTYLVYLLLRQWLNHLASQQR